MKLISLANIKKIKEIINDNLWWNVEALKPIKSELEKSWEKNIDYFEIKIAIAMIGKWDI